MKLDKELISAIVGYISLSCWVIVFTPQIWKNFQEKTGKGLSVIFLWIWLIGDVFSIAGIIIEGLLPTMLYLGVYHALADILLIAQVYYYQKFNNREERDPLLPALSTGSGTFFPTISTISTIPTVPVIIQEDPDTITVLGSSSRIRNGLPLGRSTRHNRGDLSGRRRIIHGRDAEMNKAAVIVCAVPLSTFLSVMIIYNRGIAEYFGWLSAFLYIGARFPQILKNCTDKSVAGLSWLMFLFAITGNVTYCASILIKSLEKEYIISNLPWLVGAGGTLLFDIVIAIQFLMYDRGLPPVTPPIV
jgi:uncharacterized protein with PQ loop repeat